MIDIRYNCENCNKALPRNSEEAMFCAFECTFCRDCVNDVLQNVCPNCGGGFEKRPVLPKQYEDRIPKDKKEIFKPVDMEEFEKTLATNKNIPPAQR